MSPHTVNNFVSDLVLMAQAVEKLPQVEAELEASRSDNAKANEYIMSLKADLEQARTYAATLEQKVRETEASRDDAELRFLELDEKAHKILGDLASVITLAKAAELELSPPKPEPMPEPNIEPIPLPDQSASNPTSIGSTVESNAAPVDTNQSTAAPTEPGVYTAEPVEVPKSDVNPFVAASGTDASTAGAVPTESASPQQTTEPSPNSTRFASKLYYDHPHFLTREEWLAGGGSEHSYDWRPGHTAMPV
jgi:hypothetical protein